MIRVLSCTANQQLRSSREMILRHAGCQVVSSESKAEALELLQGGGFDVLLLGHSLSAASINTLCEVFRSYIPSGRIVVVSGANTHSCAADAVVEGLDGPETLIRAVTEDQRSTA
jgi:CheY-like chemotaxis protein